MSDANGINDGARIDVVSDVVCPWCFVGKRRLEQAIALAPDVPASIFWRPFQLDGTIPKGGIPREEYLNRKFGVNRAKDMYARLEKLGEEVGIPFAFEKIKVSPNTLDAHRLLRWAQTVGTQSAVKERLLTLFFIEGEDIGDHDLLAEVGAQNGLDRATIERLLSGATDEEEVREEIATAQRMGINGVPFFIFNNKVGASGAQPAEVLLQGIRQGMASESEA
jgi:predicted DsbA family dithiol-disulfide isomerase